MGNIIVDFFPPLYWQDHERLTYEMSQKKNKFDFVERYGRNGQAQYGVDIYGRETNGKAIAIQCKRKESYNAAGNMLAGGQITESIIDEEIMKLDKFEHEIDVYIIASTASRDTKVQDYVFKKNNNDSLKFIIQIWFWEDYIDLLNTNEDLVYKYYDMLLKSKNTYSKDKHYLQLIKIAFDRPAFKTIFRLENCAENFINVISATQNVISTGRLLDSNGGIIDDVVPPSKKDSRIKKINKELQKIRDFYTDAISRNLIFQNDNFIEIRDLTVADNINKIRKRLLVELNSVLEDNNFIAIESPLLEDKAI